MREETNVELETQNLMVRLKSRIFRRNLSSSGARNEEAAKRGLTEHYLFEIKEAYVLSN